MSSRDLRKLWETFSRGDHLKTSELKILIRSAEQGMEYLNARGEKLAAAKTAMDLSSLRSYLWARKNL